MPVAHIISAGLLIFIFIQACRAKDPSEALILFAIGAFALTAFA